MKFMRNTRAKIDGPVHHLDQNFEGRLQFAGHATRGATRGDTEQNEEKQRERAGKKHAVEVECPECTMSLIHREVSQVMLDVFR
jgi:hypothetical protein